AAQRLTALVRDPTAAPVTLTLSVPKGPTLLMAVLALGFYGLIVWGAGKNAVFSIEGEKLVVRQRWFGLVRKIIELPRQSVSDVQLKQVRSLYRVELVMNDGSRVFACTVGHRRGPAEAEKVRQLALRGAA
ncbi:MAG: hypothetical protein JNK82_18205, partial [Myxococcaceae bacterium]|nr:hypothetical protein [Myxococcaceae bacterium]